jgi:hypothetical protein
VVDAVVQWWLLAALYRYLYFVFRSIGIDRRQMLYTIIYFICYLYLCVELALALSTLLVDSIDIYYLHTNMWNMHELKRE